VTRFDFDSQLLSEEKLSISAPEEFESNPELRIGYTPSLFGVYKLKQWKKKVNEFKKSSCFKPEIHEN